MDFVLIGFFVIAFVLVMLAPIIGEEDRPEFKNPNERPKKRKIL